MSPPLQAALRQLELAPPQASGALGMIPLCHPDPAPLGEAETYALFADALRAATIEITEVSESGTVPELAAVNRGHLDVLLVDGEELIGAKQNRMVNVSILVPAHGALRIPVSCVEAGRWHHRTTAFTESPNTVYARARAEKARQVSESMRHGRRNADQIAVWAEIARKSAALRVQSDTSAMSDVYTDMSARLAESVAGFAPLPAQVGAVFTVGGTVAGAELFDRPRTFASYLPKLVRGYALDALELGPDQRPTAHVSRRAGAAFLRRVATSPWQAYAAIGSGEDLRCDVAGMTGGALVANGRVVHLTAMCMG